MAAALLTGTSASPFGEGLTYQMVREVEASSDAVATPQSDASGPRSDSLCRVQVNSESERAVFTVSSTPAITYAERISDALREMRRRLEEIFPDRVVGFVNRKATLRSKRGNTIDLIVLVADVVGATPDERADASTALLEFLVSQPDGDVFNDLTVEIREGHA